MRWLPMSANCQVLIESGSTLVGSGISCESPAIALGKNRERTRERTPLLTPALFLERVMIRANGKALCVKL
jgi:hypothetical protein